MWLYPCKPIRIFKGAPILATIEDNPLWVAEAKWNGIRCIAKKENGKVELWTRHRTLIQDPVPEIRRLLAKQLPDNTIIDGELMVRRSTKSGTYHIFDVIMARGQLKTNLPLVVRREVLEKLIRPDGKYLTITEQHTTGKIAFYNKVIKRADVEGIVLKRTDSKYKASPNRAIEHPLWLKLKEYDDHMIVGGIVT
jgi:DNA ligase-1